MQPLVLDEFRSSEPIQLTVEERDALMARIPELRMAPAAGGADAYVLTPGSWVGAITVGARPVEIRPKVGIGRLLFLVSYALGAATWQDESVHYARADSLIELLIRIFARHVERAFTGGVLQGYRTEETAITGLRGRVRFAEQVTRRFGVQMPVEVRFDDFTEDILENRLIKSALMTLGRLRLRSAASHMALRRFAPALEHVELQTYDPSHVPTVTYTRLNERYRQAVEWARLILGHASIESSQGRVMGTGVLFDMNVVFEAFVRSALRECLHVASSQWPDGATCPPLYLDDAKRVRLQPDLSWWVGPTCRFVGDVKYKRVNVAGVKHPDLYQLLAYTTATNLDHGLLVYAAGEEIEVVTHDIRYAGKHLHVRCLDLTGPIAMVRQEIQVLGTTVKEMMTDADAA